MEICFNYKEIENTYSKFECSDFRDRYIPFELFEKYLKKNIANTFSTDIIGYSEQHKPIYRIDVGQGSQKVLIWSQMHGNESTTTKALLDFLNYVQLNRSHFNVQSLLNCCQLRIVPMLNPDGASLYTRKNANDVDLNRDASNKTQKETKSFFKALNEFKPDFCFNMHDQRTIFSAGKKEYPATLSFLSPSYDEQLNVNYARRIGMKLIVAAYEVLMQTIPDQIGRYDDTHNINCFGDYIQHMNIPTVLFEAGHFVNDYQRNETRKYVLLSYLKMLEVVANNNIHSYIDEKYFQIPLNQKLYYDCIIKNVKNSNSNFIGIQFTEHLKNKKVIFQPYVTSLEDLSLCYAHKYLNAEHSNVFINDSNELKTNLLIKKLNINQKLVNL
ncbi:M14 family zinc carboxypeptidase [Psychroflexus sp. MBR-150]|jgi:hypothetical protein